MAAETLSVVELTSDNIEAVLEVTPLPEQLRHVNPVAWYVARSAYQDVWHPVGLATGDGQVVAFAEWAFDDSDSTYALGGIVVDHRHQGRGLGRAVLDALVAHVRAQPQPGIVVLTVHDDNERARGLYRRYGFEETGDLLDDELVMVLPDA
ncbi:MAG TPA: N-acetyltransferase [Actinomycetes bacterium]|nr:N-acetyltransferase [Actinomycetes bacterium]